LDFVSGEAAGKAKADHIERNLFKFLLSMGAKLLLLFFTTRSNLCSRESIQTKTGETLPYHRDTSRIYFSIFGKISFKRPYFYKQGVGGQIPLMESLALVRIVIRIFCEKYQNTLEFIMFMAKA
jgi:hypothetical protein